MTIPTLTWSHAVTRLLTLVVIGISAAASNVSAQEDVAEIPSRSINAGADLNKQYFLIGPRPHAEAPTNGYRLLFVLPGGDGSAEFNPFVRRILKFGLTDRYLIVQLVAPAWSDDPDRIVWPTKTNLPDEARFSTEEFIAQVLTEVRKTYKIDQRYVFTLGWSSGGPPCYAASLTPATGITGSFIAMSVFKPDQLPSLEHAKGQAYFLLHSPEDFIPIRMAEQARNDLRQHGAKTDLRTYPGGHGWRGPVYANILDGIKWLEENCASPLAASSTAPKAGSKP
jgi:predicted esterase